MIYYMSHMCVCVFVCLVFFFVFFFFFFFFLGGCRGKNKNRSGRIVVAAGREGMCNVYKTIDGGVKRI